MQQELTGLERVDAGDGRGLSAAHLDEAAARLQAPSAVCGQEGHLWSGVYSFGGTTWSRDCLRCFTCEVMPPPLAHYAR